MGIVVGLATFGKRVIETVGKNITEVTPTRGFAAEFGAAATILVGSRDRAYNGVRFDLFFNSL